MLIQCHSKYGQDVDVTQVRQELTEALESLSMESISFDPIKHEDLNRDDGTTVKVRAYDANFEWMDQTARLVYVSSVSLKPRLSPTFEGKIPGIGRMVETFWINGDEEFVEKLGEEVQSVYDPIISPLEFYVADQTGYLNVAKDKSRDPLERFEYAVQAFVLERAKFPLFDYTDKDTFPNLFEEIQAEMGKKVFRRAIKRTGQDLAQGLVAAERAVEKAYASLKKIIS